MNYDVTQAEEAITESVGFLVANNRKGVVKILRKNGVDVNESMSDKELLTAIYTALSASTAFGVDLKKLIYTSTKEAYQEMSGYANMEGLYMTPQIGSALVKTASTATTTQTTTTKKPFGEFLKGIFTPETTSALINTGVNALSKKLTAKEDAAMLDRAIALKVNETEASIAKSGATAQKNKWLVPAIVVGGLVVVAVTAIIIYRKSKK